MDVNELVEAARSVLPEAYSPYSGIRVGAAIDTDRGVFTGVNVENASYGLSMCAERVAVFNAVTSGARDLRTIAIVSDQKDPLPPCGACRQVLAEFNPHIQIILEGSTGKRIITNLEELLPRPFLASHLSRES